MKKQMLFLTGTILLSTVLAGSTVLASSTQKAAGEKKEIATKVVMNREPIDYKLNAREFIVKKYGEQFEKVRDVYETRISLPYSKVELWAYSGSQTRLQGHQKCILFTCQS